MAGDATNIIMGSATISLDGTDLGFTKGGVMLRQEPEFVDVFADQVAGVVKKARSSERYYVQTTMLELTLENLRKAFMLPNANLTGGGSTLTLGYNDSCWVDEVAIVLVGQSPNCGTRTFTLTKCITFNTKELNMSREEEAAVQVEFEAIKDSDGNAGTVIDS